jgi:mannosyltransferase
MSTLLHDPAHRAPSRRLTDALPRGELLALAALSALALALRTTSLSRSLFNDEAYSLALSQRSIGEMVKLFGWEANGTLYSIVLWPLTRLFGDSVELVRLPSVIAGTASVPAIWWCARQFGSRRVAWVAAVLLALNPMAVWYSQEARAYAFVVLAACVAFGALARAAATDGDTSAGRRGAWIGYVAAMAAMAYCDLLAAPLALPAQALIARRAGPRAWRAWLRSLLALAICCVPLLVFASISRSRRNALYWLPKTDRGLVELALQEFSAGYADVKAVGWLTLLAGLALVALALWRASGPRLARRRSDIAVAATWGLLPAAALLVVSFVEPLFWPRYVIMSIPGLCLLAGLAAERAWSSSRAFAALAGACVAALVALAAFADVRQRHEVQQDWGPVASWLRTARAPGQPMVVDSAQVLPSLGYYDPALRAPGGQLIVQEWRDLPLPAGFVGFKDPTGYGSVPDGPPSAAVFATLARRGGGTVWLIVSEVDDLLQSDPKHGAAVAWARAHCRVQVREGVGAWAMRASGCSEGG